MARHTCIQFRGARERERPRARLHSRKELPKTQQKLRGRGKEALGGGGVAVAWPGPVRP